MPICSRRRCCLHVLFFLLSVVNILLLVLFSFRCPCPCCLNSLNTEPPYIGLYAFLLVCPLSSCLHFSLPTYVHYCFCAGSSFQVQFMSPVRNAPELSNETRVDEEQRWVSRGHSQATLEIRRKLPDLRDGNRESCSCSCPRSCSCC